MIDEVKTFIDKISEHSLLLFAVFAAGVILLLAGAAGGINFNKLSIPIAEFSLKIIVIVVGIGLIATTVFLLFFGNKKIDKDYEYLKLKIKDMEEDIHAINKNFQLSTRKVNEEICPPEEIQQKNDDAAFCMLRRLLNSESKIHKPEIIEAFSNASLAARYQIFGAIKQYREDMVYKLLLERNKIEEVKIKENISCLVAPLEVLVEIEQISKNSQCTHEIFINLAYAYKDSRHPLWDRALKFIDLAIKDRDSRNIDRRFYVNYEINRILCNINLKKNHDVIDNDFEWIWSFEDGRNHVMTVPPVLFPDFYDWMVNNKMNNITEWLRQHADKQDEWFNMFSSEQFKEKIRRNL